MGYYVDITDCRFFIPENEIVLNELKGANQKYDHLKTGGSWGNGEQQQKWFSWMPADYDQKVNSVQEVFEMLGFDCEYDSDKGMVEIVGYGDKTGAEDVFLSVVAPYVESGSYIEWRGEDGELWRNEVRNGQLYILGAEINWINAQPVTFPKGNFINELIAVVDKL